jgi:multiple sugar transport system ATP-binding protein
MKGGMILQCDTPLRVYDFPASNFVGGFIGNPPMNLLAGQVMANGSDVHVEVGGVRFEAPASIGMAMRGAIASGVWLGIRAENIETSPAPADGALQGLVLVVEPLGSHNLLTVQVGNERVKVNTHADAVFQPGQSIWLRLASDKIRWMDRESGMALIPDSSAAPVREVEMT